MVIFYYRSIYQYIFQLCDHGLKGLDRIKMYFCALATDYMRIMR